LWKNKHIHS